MRVIAQNRASVPTAHSKLRASPVPAVEFANVMHRKHIKSPAPNLCCVLVMAFAICSTVAHSQSQAPLKDDQSAKKAPAEVSTSEAQAAKPAEASTWPDAADEIQVPRLKELDPKTISERMDEVFGWRNSHNYTYLLHQILNPRNLETDLSADVLRIQNAKEFLYDPTNPRNPKYPIKIEFPESFRAIAEESDKKLGICVRLDGLGQPLPLRAASKLASYAKAGFIARSVLNHVLESLPNADTQTQGAPFSLDLDVSQDEFPKIPSAYYQLPTASTNDPKAYIEQQLDKYNLQALGIVYGWRIASEMGELNGSEAQAKSYQAALFLLNSQYSPKQIAHITAFTLNFMTAFGYVAELRRFSPSNTMDSTNSLLTAQLQSGKLPAASSISRVIHEYMLNQQDMLINYGSGVSLNQGDGMKYRNAYRDFFEGWFDGAQQSLEIITEFSYKSGVLDGFKAGYAAGSKDGFTVGWSNAWSQANIKIKQLENQISTANVQLSEEKQRFAKLAQEKESADRTSQNLRDENTRLTAQLSSQNKPGSPGFVSKAVGLGKKIGGFFKKFW